MPIAKKIRTLVVDDSVFMRTMLKNALAAAPTIDVIGSAQNGHEALEKIKSLKPDVVTLDIEMPGLDGIAVLKRVMASSPIPVVMVSTKTQDGEKLTFEALDAGAVDYVAKPLAGQSASLQCFQKKVIHAVETAYAANLVRLGSADRTRILKPRAVTVETEGVVAAIGISAHLAQTDPHVPQGVPSDRVGAAHAREFHGTVRPTVEQRIATGSARGRLR